MPTVETPKRRLRTWLRRVRHRYHGTAHIRVAGGYVLHVHGGSRWDKSCTMSLVRHGVWEPVETELLLGMLEPGMTFVDAGANLGYYTVLASRCVGDAGSVVAFEPEPANFALLERSVRANRCGNVALHRSALGDEAEGTIDLHLCADNAGGHQIHPLYTPHETVSVPLTSVDAVLDGRPVDVVKMDTQGAEGRILAGMQETLQRSQRLAIVTEFWPGGLRQVGSDPEELLRSLLDAGFTMEVLLDEVCAMPRADGRLTAPIEVAEALATERYLNLVFRRA